MTYSWGGGGGGGMFCKNKTFKEILVREA